MSATPLPKIARYMNSIVSFYAYGIAFLLVTYMLANLVAGAWNYAASAPEMISIVTSMDPAIHEERHGIEALILHFIAMTIVLIKAYTIVISYARDRHINIKHMVEIAIIAPAVEILFNSSVYSLEILLLFAGFGLGNLVIYVLWYDKFKEIGKGVKRV